jgi:hypothetical protein
LYDDDGRPKTPANLRALKQTLEKMQSRNTREEMQKVKNQLKMLMQGLKGKRVDPCGSSDNPLTGLYKLNELRSFVTEDKLEGLDEQGMRHLQMTLINDYCNGYTKKLSLPETEQDGQLIKIELDKAELDKKARDPNFNPMSMYTKYK